MPSGVDSEAMLAKMRLDKKAVSGNLRLILWHGIGKAFIADSIDAAPIQDFLKSHSGRA
jgi:3-dehydroquinate synthase